MAEETMLEVLAALREVLEDLRERVIKMEADLKTQQQRQTQSSPPLQETVAELRAQEALKLAKLDQILVALQQPVEPPKLKQEPY